MTESAVSSLDDVTCTALRSFRGEEFVVHLSHHASEGRAGAAALAVRVACERLRDSTLWSADFSASYIEELTSKTGTPKRLAAFSAMLRAGLSGRSATVSLDFLTAADLEALKRRRQGEVSSSSQQAPSSNQVAGKRYLVLSHAPEFGDRVHLPLPLLPCASLPGSRLPSAELIMNLRIQNEALRAELAAARETQHLRNGASASSSYSGPSRALEARLEAAETELEALGAEHVSLQRRSASEMATLMAELSARREGERAYRLKLANARAEIDSLMRRLRATEARVGLRGSAAAANFTYSRAGSRPSSAHGSRPLSPHTATSSRNASPARMMPPAGLRSPYSSNQSASLHRTSSAPRERRPSPLPAFDPTAYAAERAQRVAAAAALRAQAFGGTASRGGSPGPGSRSGTPVATPGWRSPAQSPRGGLASGGRSGGAPSGSGRESPSTALQHVKARLHAFTGKAPVDARPPVSEDNTAAIADIDARLHALQDFLRAAKATTA